jgi:hypothetical protein
VLIEQPTYHFLNNKKCYLALLSGGKPILNETKPITMNEAEMALRLQFSVTCKAFLTCPRGG